MSDTQYVTDDIAFAALILMVFGNEVLTGIEILPDRQKLFKFEAVPRFDCDEYRREWDSAEGLAVSNVRAYMKAYFSLAGHLREMNVTNSKFWEPERGERWWVRAREQGDKIQRLREEFEKKKLCAQ
jgi:hypothetical protein